MARFLFWLFAGLFLFAFTVGPALINKDVKYTGYSKEIEVVWDIYANCYRVDYFVIDNKNTHVVYLKYVYGSEDQLDSLTKGDRELDSAMVSILYVDSILTKYNQ